MASSDCNFSSGLSSSSELSLPPPVFSKLFSGIDFKLDDSPTVTLFLFIFFKFYFILKMMLFANELLYLTLFIALKWQEYSIWFIKMQKFAWQWGTFSSVILQAKPDGLFFLHDGTISNYLPKMWKMWFYGWKSEPNRRECNLCGASLPSSHEPVTSAVLSSHKRTSRCLLVRQMRLVHLHLCCTRLDAQAHRRGCWCFAWLASSLQAVSKH